MKLGFARIRALALSLAVMASAVNARATPEDVPDDVIEAKPAAPRLARAPSIGDVPVFSFDLPKDPSRPRNVVWPQLASILVPGLDQWWEGQTKAAAVYTGTAIGGLWIATNAAERLRRGDSFQLDEVDLDNRNDDVRLATLGLQIYSAAGSLSAYSSFRSAVRTRKELGEYTFLTSEETTDELLLAPFEFSFAKRPTTWIPLAIAGAAVAVELSGKGNAFRGNSFRGSDVAFGSAFSFLAGTHEEALFRGWMMPVLMESWNSEFWSNTATAAVFAAAHLSAGNTLPWPQFVLGWYFGYQTQTNGWSLKEAIFVHTWWDVLIFTGAFLSASRDDRNAQLFVPLLNVTY